MQALAYEVEDSTGGLVIWLSGSKLLVYRDQEFNEHRKVWQKLDKQRRLTQSRSDLHVNK